MHNSLEEFKKKAEHCSLQSQLLYDKEMEAEFSGRCLVIFLGDKWEWRRWKANEKRINNKKEKEEKWNERKGRKKKKGKKVDISSFEEKVDGWQYSKRITQTCFCCFLLQGKEFFGNVLNFIHSQWMMEIF